MTKEMKNTNKKLPDTEETEEYIRGWKDLPCFCIDWINIVKCPFYYKQPADSMQTLIKIPMQLQIANTVLKIQLEA